MYFINLESAVYVCILGKSLHNSDLSLDYLIFDPIVVFPILTVDLGTQLVDLRFEIFKSRGG